MTRAIVIALALLAGCGGPEPRPCSEPGAGTCLDGHLVAVCEAGEWHVRRDCAANRWVKTCMTGPGWYSVCPDFKPCEPTCLDKVCGVENDGCGHNCYPGSGCYCDPAGSNIPGCPTTWGTP